VSSENEAWAMQQECPSPLAKLLLWRIASGMGENGRQTFDQPHLARFCGCGFKEFFAAIKELTAAGLLQNFGEIGDYGIDLAFPWYQRPDPRTFPRRKLQSKARIREGLIRLQDGRCWYCGKRFDECNGTPHVEHQTPLSRGGADAFANLVMACGRCNTDKGDRTLEEYRDVVSARECDRDPPPGIVDVDGLFAGERWE